MKIPVNPDAAWAWLKQQEDITPTWCEIRDLWGRALFVAPVFYERRERPNGLFWEWCDGAPRTDVVFNVTGPVLLLYINEEGHTVLSIELHGTGNFHIVHPSPVLSFTFG